MRGSITYGSPGNVSSVTVNKPSGLAANDVCVIEFLLYDGSTLRSFSAAPTGWNVMSAISGSWTPSTGGQINLYRYWYRATGSDPASWTWNVSTGTSSIQYQIGTYIGCATSITPVEFSTATQSATAGSSVVAPAVTLTYTNSKLVFIANNTNGRTYTPPASDGWTERHEDSGTNNYWADKDQAASGSTGTKTFTMNASDPYNGVLIGLIDQASIGGGSGVTAAGATTQAAGSLAGAATETIAGAGATTQAAGTPAGALVETILGTGATAQGAGTLAGAGTETIAGVGGTTQAAGTLAGAALETITGAGATTQQAGALAGVGTVGADVAAAGATAQAAGSLAGALTLTYDVAMAGATTQAPAVLAGAVIEVFAGAGATVQAVGSSAGVLDFLAGGASGGEAAEYGPLRVVLGPSARRAAVAFSRRRVRITSEEG